MIVGLVAAGLLLLFFGIVLAVRRAIERRRRTHGEEPAEPTVAMAEVDAAVEGPNGGGQDSSAASEEAEAELLVAPKQFPEARGSLVAGRVAITPAEIRQVDLRRTWLRGYRRTGVDELLDDIANSLAEVSRERTHLSGRLEELEAEAANHRELEALLLSTLVSAERAAQDMKEQARRESDLIVQEAHAESRRVMRESAAQKHRLEEEMITIRAQLRAAFEMLVESPRTEPTKREQAASVTGPAAIGDALDSGIRRVVG